MNNFKYLILSMRFHQWIKNLLVFAALVFSGHIFDLNYLVNSTLIFIYFCLASSGIYIINDIFDREQDANHPVKKERPIAAGNLKLPFAILGTTILTAISLFGSFLINYNSGVILSIYVILTSLYSIKLKHIVILDIVSVAIGFVLRAVAGAVAIEVYISPWLLVCTFFLALFLVIGKRRQELLLLDENAINHRKIFDEYNIKLLDQMIVVVTAIPIVSYALYTLDTNTIKKFHTEKLIYTIPFVILGIFRYLYLIYKKNLGGTPERIFLSDKGILATIVIWIVVVSLIIY